MRHETNRERVEKLMVELGRAAREPGRIYFTGGVSAVLIGWREMTMDVDLKPDPEPVGIFEALAKIERDHDRDRRDVAEMFARGLVMKDRLAAYFREIEPKLVRFPAIEPRAFALRVNTVCQP